MIENILLSIKEGYGARQGDDDNDNDIIVVDPEKKRIMRIWQRRRIPGEKKIWKNNSNNVPDPNPVIVKEEREEFEGQGMGDNFNPRLMREMRRIDRFNPAVNAYVNQYSLRTNRDQMHMAFYMVDHVKIDPSKYTDVFNIPNSWQEAWNHPDPWLHNRWREAIAKELLKMKMNKVWDQIKRSQMHPGRVCIKGYLI
jgi:hypothetical protein